MKELYEIESHQIYQLKSIDPLLSDNWISIIREELPKFSLEARNSIYQNILIPRGIFYKKKEKRFFYKKTKKGEKPSLFSNEGWNCFS